MRGLFNAVVLACGLGLAFAPDAHAIVRGKPVHGLALYGEPKYPADFKHFEYVNPDAPKGGTFVKTNEAYLTFDTFNPYTVKGASVHGLEMLLFDTLMVPSLDEPASVYGLIAQTAEVADDNSWVEFVLRPEARFADGSAITAEDVAFSYEVLIGKATPRYRGMYADVAKAEALNPNTVRFTFKTKENRKLPFLLAKYLPVLSKAYWKDRDFTATTLDVPVTNGPYGIESFEAGKYILYKRRGDYWAKDLPVNRGFNNFDHIRFEYFRDDDVEFEAFKTGVYDFRRETSAGKWATGYEFPAAQDGRVKKMEMKSIEPLTVQPVFLNLRRPLFQDRRVRMALSYAFDFESLNLNLFHKQYVRSRSYWQGSSLEATGLPSAEELKLLEPFREKVPPEVFTAAFTHLITAGNGDIRENLLKARELLKEAGWELRGDKLVNMKTGQPFAFEFLLRQQGSERVYVPFAQNLKRLGIEMTLRQIDTSQFINRLNDFDYDATVVVFPHNDLTPGTEQLENWGSQAADVVGSNNASGVKDPVVDALIKKIIGAETYEEVTAATRALDRVLTWNYYQILTYTSPGERYAFWSKLKMPEPPPPLGLGGLGEFSTGLGETSMVLWWMDPASAAPTQPATSTETAEKPPASAPWGLIALVIVGAGMVLFVILRQRRTSP
ncbi:MAG: extracellular solute-binding protein [Rhodospirillaceae bacterium]|nr:extracellular solute-binding protein [Rhodospirillaceae bacterium]